MTLTNLSYIRIKLRFSPISNLSKIPLNFIINLECFKNYYFLEKILKTKNFINNPARCNSLSYISPFFTLNFPLNALHQLADKQKHPKTLNSMLNSQEMQATCNKLLISLRNDKKILSLHRCCWCLWDGLRNFFSYFFARERRRKKIESNVVFFAVWSLLLLPHETDSSIKDINSQACGSFIVLNFKRHLRFFPILKIKFLFL